MQYKTSQFNHAVSLETTGETFLFNCLKASLIRLPAELEAVFGDVSQPVRVDIDTKLAEDAKLSVLVHGGFLVDADSDELDVIRNRFYLPSLNQALALTIAPTMNCNLACFYCYQEHTQKKMDQMVCDRLVHEVFRKLADGTYRKLSIDWYGGEPLLALDAIEYLSDKLIRLAEESGVDYAATMVTNGTRLNEKTAAILSRLKVNHIQITLDGPPDIHNLNRPFKGGKASFDTILQNIKTASRTFDLLIRINVNRETLDDAYRLLDILADHGIFSNGKKVLPYISMIGPLSSTCRDTARKAFSSDHFYRHVLDFQKAVLKKVPNLSIDDVMEIPKPLNRACGAQNPDSICIHPTGQVFKCGLEIHEPSSGASFVWEDYKNHINCKKWMSLDPLEIEACASCTFLPLCMGGCAKYNFDENQFYKGESCNHWHHNLDMILKQIIELRSTIT